MIMIDVISSLILLRHDNPESDSGTPSHERHLEVVKMRTPGSAVVALFKAAYQRLGVKASMPS